MTQPEHPMPANHGLTQAEAARALETFGPNELQGQAPISAFSLLVRQFNDVLIYILVAAAVISLAIGEWVDAVAILSIVVLNGILGFVQEWRAEEALAALNRLLTPRARVIRDGVERVIDARELVPGDHIILEIGERVPADAVLLEANNLHVDESLLTGESVAVHKSPGPTEETASIAERAGEVFMSTVVTNGWARGRVTGTGMKTEIGKIAQLTQSLSAEATPLQRKLALLGKQLGAIGLGASALVAIGGLLEGRPLMEMFLTAVALAVAVVPEGLPAVVTLTLALGVKTMVRRHALIRRLSAAEALGAATVICTDKTGTLTQNQMTVTHIWTASHAIEVSGTGYGPEGGFFKDGERVEPAADEELRQLLAIGLRCNHAALSHAAEGWSVVGEPTEGALIAVARKAGVETPNGDAAGGGPGCLTEFSFNSDRKRMTVVCEDDGDRVAFVKGAVEILLPRCVSLYEGGQARAMRPADRERINDELARLGRSGRRTLGFAFRRLDPGIALDADEVEQGLTFVGLVGIEDPPREGVKDAIRACRTAGIRVIMVTGDAAPTAKAIASQIGLAADDAMTGAEIDSLTDAEFAVRLKSVSVFARVSPAHKMRIVELLQKSGEIVAMTGDGANDAPALRGADVGIAMGLRGTDVAKGAADMVLTDDNFVSIVGAVEEGRREFANILKFVRYLLSSNTGELIAILANILLGGPLILLPVQILWMNLVTDGVTALALGLEPSEPGSMKDPPRHPSTKILSGRALAAIAALGGLIGFGTYYLFRHGLSTGMDETQARTLAFTAIIIFEKINVFNFRSMRSPLLRLGIFSNPYLCLALLLNIGLQIVAVYAPPMQSLLQTAPLPLHAWWLIAAIGAPLLIVGEVYKTWFVPVRAPGPARPPSVPAGEDL